MKLTRRVRYALRMMVDIAKRSGDGRRVPLSQVARSTCMPRPFLEQLAIPLRRAELLESTIGRGGGYVLARPAGQIRVSEIVESVGGPVAVTECAVDAGSCPQSDGCECRLLYTRINDGILALLGELSLAEITADSWRAAARLEPRRDLGAHGSGSHGERSRT